jgi:CRISPR-associated endonuclease/helicase Cas3
MNTFTIKIKPQYVKLTTEKEIFTNGKESFLHEVQKRMKLDFDKFPEFTIITAPTGTGKSYAFPFPVINSKKKNSAFDEDKIRGLIVLPTNALIDELSENFSKTYPFLKIEKLTGKTLDDYAVKGFNRWLKVLELCKGDTDLVITNPDIINYAMHGGYHTNAWQNTGRKEFHNFLESFGYVIFDEYHLYDESQIANILTLTYLRNIFLNENSKIKYLFASATPEKSLKDILINQGYTLEEIIEEITEDNSNARAIHGELEVEFQSTTNMLTFINDKIDEIKGELNNKKKVLIILDKLNEVQLLSERLASFFPKINIYQSTGYVSKIESQNEKVKQANIIIATNKAEVGVNYEVEYCIMQPGKYFRNFVQRFGRVSRGDLEGKVIICIDNVKYNSLKRIFQNSDSVSYYEFIGNVQSVMDSKKFYSERVPFYLGEYIWCIEQSLRNQKGGFNSFQYFKERLDEEGFFKNKEAYSRYKLFSEINKIIFKIAKIFPKGLTAQAWKAWWENYLNTFLFFRDSSLVVQIFDKKFNMELNYSLDWILRYKEILNIEETKKGDFLIKKYTVGDLKDRDKNIQYHVNTIPSVGAKENEFLSPSDLFNLQSIFENAVKIIYEKNKKGVEDINKLQIELLDKVKFLSKTFDRKRLKILEIEGNNNFL